MYNRYIITWEKNASNIESDIILDYTNNKIIKINLINKDFSFLLEYRITDAFCE